MSMVARPNSESAGRTAPLALQPLFRAARFSVRLALAAMGLTPFQTSRLDLPQRRLRTGPILRRGSVLGSVQQRPVVIQLPKTSDCRLPGDCHWAAVM